MTPADIASKWASLQVVFNQIALDIKTLTFGVESKRTEGQVNAQIDLKLAELTGLAPTVYNTFQKIAQEMVDDDTEFSALVNVVSGKADLSLVTPLPGRISDVEAILNGLPSLLELYNEAKR
jgi:hypothetical protein